LSERLRNVDFDSPAKIFQNKHAIHQFVNVTPDTPRSPALDGRFHYDSDDNMTSGSQTPQHSYTPRSASPDGESSQAEFNKKRHSSPPQQRRTPSLPDNNSSSPKPSPSESTEHTTSSSRPISHTGSTATISRTNTPSQFVFKKPEYNSHYHHTHFHHLEKKDTVFHDLRKFFKKNHDKKKKKSILDDTSVTSVKSSGSSVYSKQSDLSFANEFNKNLEGRYGKWGK
jgi:hypothetical protein